MAPQDAVKAAGEPASRSEALLARVPVLLDLLVAVRVERALLVVEELNDLPVHLANTQLMRLRFFCLSFSDLFIIVDDFFLLFFLLPLFLYMLLYN